MEQRYIKYRTFTFIFSLSSYYWFY